MSGRVILSQRMRRGLDWGGMSFIDRTIVQCALRAARGLLVRRGFFAALVDPGRRPSSSLFAIATLIHDHDIKMKALSL